MSTASPGAYNRLVGIFKPGNGVPVEESKSEVRRLPFWSRDWEKSPERSSWLGSLYRMILPELTWRVCGWYSCA